MNHAGDLQGQEELPQKGEEFVAVSYPERVKFMYS